MPSSLFGTSPSGAPLAGIQQIKNMMQMLSGNNNSQAMLQMLAAQNPQLRQVLDYVQQSGGDPKEAFYKLAQEKGVDPNQIINMLK